MEFYITIWQCSGCGALEFTLGDHPRDCQRMPHNARSRWQIVGHLLANNPNEANEASDGGA